MSETTIPNPPMSSKARKALAASEAMISRRETYTRSYMDEGLQALFATWRDLDHVEINERDNPGFAQLVVYIKGEAAASAFQKHGFEVEGQSGFYQATYRGKR